MSTQLGNISEGDKLAQLPELFTVCNTLQINSQQVTIYETQNTDVNTSTDTENVKTNSKLYILCYQEDSSTTIVQRIFTQLDVLTYDTNQKEINSFFIQDVDIQTVLNNIIKTKIKSEVLNIEQTNFNLTLEFIRDDLCEITITESVKTHIAKHIDEDISKEEQVYVKQAIPDTLSVEFHFVNTHEM